MNLIMCNENCKYQADGYCKIEGISKVTDVVTSDCCYYDKKDAYDIHDKRQESSRVKRNIK